VPLERTALAFASCDVLSIERKDRIADDLYAICPENLMSDAMRESGVTVKRRRSPERNVE
jgi:hypothetical protein